MVLIRAGGEHAHVGICVHVSCKLASRLGAIVNARLAIHPVRIHEISARAVNLPPGERSPRRHSLRRVRLDTTFNVMAASAIPHMTILGVLPRQDLRSIKELAQGWPSASMTEPGKRVCKILHLGRKQQVQGQCLRPVSKWQRGMGRSEG